jgi:hypothetical protein
VQQYNDAPHRTAGQIPQNIKYVIDVFLDRNVTEAAGGAS